MKLFIIAVALCAAAGGASAQVRPRMVSAQSRSGQFTVTAMADRPSQLRNPALAGNTNLLELEPMLLAVSAERIKQAVWRELGAGPSWTGKILLALHPATSGDEPITVTSERFRDTWGYRLDLPETVERVRFVRAMVQVLLLEFANRNGRPRSAEIPLWLTEGVTQQLLASAEAQLILPLPSSRVNGLALSTVEVNARRRSPLATAHELLRNHPPLSFEQLSWPADDELSSDRAEAYRSSAQLFVADLLALKDGREAMRAMLGLLPEYYNWQIAFLRGFKAHFSRPLDIEKWWALRVVEFTGRDLAQTWSLEESWHRLDAVIHSPVQVHLETNTLPLRAEVSFQMIIREWEPVRQTVVLQNKARELEVLRMRMAQELVALVDEYRQTLNEYLATRNKRQIAVPFKSPAKLDAGARVALKRLDDLDARRETFRPVGPEVTVKTEAPSVSTR
jgi:hypothetical protein